LPLLQERQCYNSQRPTPTSTAKAAYFQNVHRHWPAKNPSG
jgi:hypothetical protein